MRRIAICGGIGSGKSLVSAVLRDLGAKVVVADEVNASLLTDPIYIEEVAHIFPTAVDNNGIKKKELAEIIYQNESDRNKLMEIAHPRIYEKMLRFFPEEKIVFYEIPLMERCPLIFESIWFIKADREVRIKRILLRDGISEEMANRILFLQTGEEGMEARADVVIDNNGSVEDVRKQVRSLYCSILNQFS